jgi:hypothetical protein
LVDFIQGKVLAALGRPWPPARESRNPIERLSEVLAEVASSLDRGQRLLIILDEINFFLDLPPDRFNPTAIDNLHYLITSRPEVCWLLIVQLRGQVDALRAAQMNRLLVEFSRLAVGHLEPCWAEKLIREPVQRCGMRYSEATRARNAGEASHQLPSVLIRLTDGHPCLIQRCCHALVEDARQRRQTTITKDDLRRVVARLVVEEDPYFDAVTRALPDLQWAMVTLVARKELPGVAPGWLRQQIRRLYPQADAILFRRAVDSLVRQGVLGVEEAGAKRTLRIRIGLLRQWVRVFLHGAGSRSKAARPGAE